MFFKPILNYIINVIIYFQKTRHNEFISGEGYSILSDSNKTRKLNIIIDNQKKKMNGILNY